MSAFLSIIAAVCFMGSLWSKSHPPTSYEMSVYLALAAILTAIWEKS